MPDGYMLRRFCCRQNGSETRANQRYPLVLRLNNDGEKAVHLKTKTAFDPGAAEWIVPPSAGSASKRPSLGHATE
jgi:hypothetical protein